MLSLSSSAPKQLLQSNNILSPRKSRIASKSSIDNNIKLDNHNIIENIINDELQDVSNIHISNWLEVYENEVDSELEDDSENLFEIYETSNNSSIDNIFENNNEINSMKDATINPNIDIWSGIFIIII